MKKINELALKLTYETDHVLALALTILPSVEFEKKMKKSAIFLT